MLLKNISRYFILILIIVSCSSSDDTDISEEENCSYTPDLIIQDVDNATDSSATFVGNITPPTCEATVTSQGFVYATTTLPKTDDFVVKVAGEDISASVSDLLPNTLYYVRSFFENPTGEYYSDQVEFTTSIGDIDIETKKASNITFESAKSGGVILNDGGAEVLTRGVCWSANPKPTVNDSFIESGSGTGSFNNSISGLEGETKYYVRAYLTNEFGVIYGDEITFETPFEEIIFQGNITLVNQQEVNDFGANGYTTIDGYLQIGFSEQASNVNNLEALSSLRSISYMRIMNTLLNDLNELSNLYDINTLEIRFNNSLKNIDGLSNISDINSISILDNEILSDFCGISNIVNNGLENYSVRRNLFNPSQEDIINGNCSE